MAMGTERSKPLHNFTLPCDLRWGNQRFLRCMKVNSGEQINSSESSDQIQQRRDGSVADDEDGIAATREKVMLDLQTAADKMKSAFFKDEVSVSRPLPLPPPAAASSEGEAHRPWNLRTRRAACKGPRVDAPRPNPGSLQPAVAQKSPTDKMERPKFSVSLSKRDIEEDFFAIAGHRPPRRPKKRARIVQKQLDTLFPGLWLTEVTQDMYKVPVAAP